MKKLFMIPFLTVAAAGGVSAFAYGINNFTVYDAKDKIVHRITDEDEVNALYLLFREALVTAADEASFTELPKDAQVLYRYVLSYDYGAGEEKTFKFIVYKNYPLCRMTPLQEMEGVPKELTWKLFKYAYGIVSKPAEVKSRLSYSAEHTYTRIYDSKGSLLLFLSGKKASNIFETALYGDDVSKDEPEERNLKDLLPSESIHKGREVLLRYSFVDDENLYGQLYLYKGTKKINMTFDTGVLKLTLSKKTYEFLSDYKNLQKEFEKDEDDYDYEEEDDDDD
ncbi:MULTISPECIES: cysteine protease [unclassified Treponema]|uniref:cysteine protease n=1 Tax=unclassified Treponema TaxID=2638727 RepID=UPI0020A412EA|nr:MULTISPECIES: cysteine protease [unclassified Treponema]UTC66813.1 cysteine protease [Treponema sp. OMZ 789]UTC69545.1 cysteine protease [Treponema sp. OMZ 790]UTC72258.1 cysteine protease [Treponema sp. OMZ 791]